MQLSATIANALWSASNLPAYLRFCGALREPQPTQQKKLRSYLERSTHTAFGKAHNLGTVRSYEEFARRVPLADYESLEPWIARIRHGELNVLTHDPVTCLVPTSGSTGARKLVPFTIGLQREFTAAIGPWLVDLQRRLPGIIGGPAYWSVTPLFHNLTAEDSGVPIGFDADTAYLGGVRRQLADAVMAVPPAVQRAGSVEAFRYETLLHLLRCRELRLISVWHPSFLTLLLDAVPMYWENLLDEIAKGRSNSFAPWPGRSNELRAVGPRNGALFWPELRVISCWGDGHAEIGVAGLQTRFPGTTIQRKGLLATEAAVTIPFCGRHPVAVLSHFFEFVDDGGRIRLANELQEGGDYEIVVTTGGGLWRYRLQDQVRVTGFVGETPSLQFLGRGGKISDRFGEKLSEVFVTGVIQEVLAARLLPRFALLAPDEDETGYGYTLYTEGEVQPEIAIHLDFLLRRNPHYAWCRELGQLRAPRLFHIRTGGFEAFASRECANGKRLGEVKPRSLSARAGWSQYFQGDYAPLPGDHHLIAPCEVR